MDAEARFRALFDGTYPTVARYARHRGLVGHDAEDLIAATYEVAWRRLDVVPAGDAALPWLLTVALNHSRNHRRRLARDRALVERLPPPGQSAPPSESSSPGWRDIRRALDALAESDRELVLLVAWDGLTPAQAAGVLGLTSTAARTRLHRARIRLADLLGVERGGPSRQSTRRHAGPTEAVRRSET
jgi:RNA polymerase sigma-70 factor (ECF subfamily)